MTGFSRSERRSLCKGCGVIVGTRPRGGPFNRYLVFEKGGGNAVIGVTVTSGPLFVANRHRPLPVSVVLGAESIHEPGHCRFSVSLGDVDERNRGVERPFAI